MQKSASRIFQLTISAFLFSIFLMGTTLFTSRAYANTTHTNINHEISASPQSKFPKNADIILNSQNEVVFSPTALSCLTHAPCFYLTNMQSQTVDLYYNGKYLTTLKPGEEISSGFNVPGTFIYTIPNTNPNTQLTVTVKQYVVPNVNVMVNQYDKVVFSPKMLSCPFNEDTCFTMTNTTAQTINVYLNNILDFTLNPYEVNNVILNGPGTSTFTIPDTNPNAKLMVIGK